jgi:predicted DNA-binding protein
MKSARLKNFHLPLPEQLYVRLRREAERSGRPATLAAREAVEGWLREREQQAETDAIARYAVECAGTPADLDSELEEAAVERLMKSAR